MRFRYSFTCVAGIAVALAAGPTRAADAPPPASEPLVVVVFAGAPIAVGLEALARLPMQQLTVSFATEHGTRSASFEGPLLWNVLQQAGAIAPEKHGDQVSETVVIVARDGYRAVVALAELAPEFEGKSVILAEKMDGQLLGAEHLRVVVPLDHRGGRSVRNVARIEVVAFPEE
jgi:hypothetical protein